MKYIYLLGFLIPLLISCGQKKGCTNELATNFDNEAIVDCCCDYKVEVSINEIIGSYQILEKCSGEQDTFAIEIKRHPNKSESILINNFNNGNYAVEAQWNDGEFSLMDAITDGCSISITGSIHKASNTIFFIYAAFSEGTCPGASGKTCEARSI